MSHVNVKRSSEKRKKLWNGIGRNEFVFYPINIIYYIDMNGYRGEGGIIKRGCNMEQTVFI